MQVALSVGSIPQVLPEGTSRNKWLHFEFLEKEKRNQRWSRYTCKCTGKLSSRRGEGQKTSDLLPVRQAGALRHWDSRYYYKCDLQHHIKPGTYKLHIKWSNSSQNDCAICHLERRADSDVSAVFGRSFHYYTFIFPNSANLFWASMGCQTIGRGWKHKNKYTKVNIV
jgi:hypothetical protein